MKHVIDGKIYNTDTAERICRLRCEHYRGDYSWHDTALYKTKKGAWFLAGEGGAKSMWSRPIGDSGRIGGSGIQVISLGAAMAIAERELTPDEMIAAGFEVTEA